MCKHTAGPWQIDRIGDVISRYAETRPGQVIVARVFANPDYQGVPAVYYQEKEANARLIAAAPEMLDALKSAVNYLDGFKGPFNHELLNLKAVIAKAEGKER